MPKNRDMFFSRLMGVTLAGLVAMAAITMAPRGAGAAADDTGTSRPNVIILFADDMRASTIHAMGNDEIKTPNLDRLVNSGTAFPHAYIEGGQGGAVCVTSRAMLITGINLHHLKKNPREIPTTATMIGETFAKAGYNTYGIGKWHNDPESFNRCFQGGDEIMMGGMTANQFDVPLFHYHADGDYSAKCEGYDGPSMYEHVSELPTQCDHREKGRHSSTIFADAAINFITSQTAAQKPYFMYVAFTAPHDPRQAPKEFLDMYPPESIKLPPNFMPEHPFDNGHTGRDEHILGYPRKPEDVKREIADYFAIINHLDSEIGRILDTLKQTGQDKNTIIVFAGDNGLAVGQHGLLGKQSVYEHSVNVPMIWTGPGIPAGQKAKAYSYLTEIYPTLCDMLGLDVPKSVDAKSFLPALKDPEKPGHDTMYFGFRDLHRAVSDGQFKLIEYNVNGERHTQLFDLKSDPWEMHNLAEDPAHADKLKELREKLKAYHKSSGDKSPFWKAPDLK